PPDDLLPGERGTRADRTGPRGEKRGHRLDPDQPGGVHAHQRGAARRTGGGGDPVHGGPPVERAPSRAVPAAFVFFRSRRRRDQRAGHRGVRSGVAPRTCAAVSPPFLNFDVVTWGFGRWISEK